MKEPLPIWPNAPRYAPEIPFPPYRFVPGLNKHPHTSSFSPLRGEGQGGGDRGDLKEDLLFLYGIDLYHQSYFWESHEAWEILWKRTDRKSPEAQFIQALIQNSAAQLKKHLGKTDAAEQLASEVLRRLLSVFEAKVCDDQGRFMGIQVEQLQQEVEQYYFGGGVAPRLEIVRKSRL